MYNILDGLIIKRDVPTKLYLFNDYFKGFNKVKAIQNLFGDQTENILNNLKVEFFSSRFGYMGLSDSDGHLLISTYHLKNSEFHILYLDIIHELFHLKQFQEGKQLFSSEYSYVDNPIEIDAYRYTIDEAKKIGMNREEIIEYLKVEWIDDIEHARLLKSLDIRDK